MQFPSSLAINPKMRQGNRPILSAALRNAAVTLLTAAILGFYWELLPLSWIYHNFTPLLTASTALSCGLAVYSYLGSFTKGKLLASGGNTDYSIYNIFMGRELNPRIASFDLKHFCELYPGMIGWLVIDLGMMQEQYKQLGYITPAMWLVVSFQSLYILDSLWFEKAILSTMDIVHDGFGFMLAFGDLTWVPFTYSLQARYLVDHPQVCHLFPVSHHFPIILPIGCHAELECTALLACIIALVVLCCCDYQWDTACTVLLALSAKLLPDPGVANRTQWVGRQLLLHNCLCTTVASDKTQPPCCVIDSISSWQAAVRACC